MTERDEEQLENLSRHLHAKAHEAIDNLAKLLSDVMDAEPFTEAELELVALLCNSARNALLLSTRDPLPALPEP